MDPRMLANNPPARRKIWEIDSCYKCALIGTCLSRTELHKLSQESVYEVPRQCDDYQRHAHFIRISDRNDAAARSLQKYLEKKYRAESKKYHKVEGEEELYALWEADLAGGRIDSAWWSISVHATASASLVARCYGQLHMISHDCTNSTYRDRQVLTALRAKVAMLEEVVGSERQFFRQEKRRLQQENNELQRQATAGSRHAEEHRRQQAQLQQLHDEIHTLRQQQRSGEEQHLIEELRQANNSLYGRVDELTGEIELLREELSQAAGLLDELQQMRSQMQQREGEQAREIASLESMLFRHVATEQDPCAHCADHNTTNCPGLNLCGKTVLYVGGLHKMVPHYRQLVEQFGGRFIHHDGGKEASRNTLPKLLSTADAVLCPIDCVSHDACNCVKKICKRYQKPLVFMRSSGLSSLAKGLGDIVQ